MGFFKDWVGNVVEDKIDDMMRGMVENPLWVDENYQQLEYKLQYQGDTQEICKFYKNFRQKSRFIETNLFWEKVNGNLPIQHFPLARMITKAKTNLVFHDQPAVSFLDSSGVEDEEKTEFIAEMWKKDSLTTFLRKAGETLSYSGAVALVPVRPADPESPDDIIWRAYPKEACDVRKVYGRVTSITVYDEISQGKDDYLLGTFIAKDGMSYKLWRLAKGMKGDKYKKNEVSLDSLPDTANLKDVEFNNPKGLPTFVYLENNLDGTSDYHGLIDDFAALDEAYSALTDLIRKGHIKTYIPKSSLIRDAGGNSYVPNDFTENTAPIPMSNPTNAPYKIERDQITLGDGVTALQSAFAFYMERAIESAGLSPATLGIDSAGANSSAEALNIRERVSMRTRAECVTVWSDAIRKMIEATLAIRYSTSSEGGLAFPELDGSASVSFPEYESPTFDQKVTSLSTALNSKLIDLKTALKQLYPDKSDDEIGNMYLSIMGALPETEEDIEAKQAEEDKRDEEDEKNEQDEEKEKPDDLKTE